MNRCRPWRIARLIALLWLSGCAAANSEPLVRLQCPPLVTYSTDEQVRAADELNRLPADAALIRFMADYAALRAALRACRGLPLSAPRRSDAP